MARSIVQILTFWILVPFQMSCWAKEEAAPKGPAFMKQTIYIDTKKVVVEIADNDTLRAHGLMYRKKLDQDSGMLFIFPYEQPLNFWMKNTFLPLSIGFFDKNKVLVDIQNMTPVKSLMDREIPQYASAKPAQYALEMNQGWFEKNKIKIGAKLTLSK